MSDTSASLTGEQSAVFDSMCADVADRLLTDLTNRVGVMLEHPDTFGLKATLAGDGWAWCVRVKAGKVELNPHDMQIIGRLLHNVTAFTPEAIELDVSVTSGQATYLVAGPAGLNRLEGGPVDNLAWLAS